MNARLLLATLALAVTAVASPPAASDPTTAVCEATGTRVADPLDAHVVLVTIPYCALESGVTAASGSDGTCTSTAYRLEGVHTSSWYSNIKVWTVGAGVDANGALAALRAAAKTWDDVTSRQVIGSMGLYPNVPGTRNGVHEIAWRPLDATTIAMTYLWIDTRDNHVLETDAAYNAALPWSLSGSAGAYDVRNTATHEFGHAFGLDHVASTAANKCLTMYPYGAKGETEKRSLGTGDWNGMRAIYGA